jgi:hypothetical protein
MPAKRSSMRSIFFSLQVQGQPVTHVAKWRNIRMPICCQRHGTACKSIHSLFFGYVDPLPLSLLRGRRGRTGLAFQLSCIWMWDHGILNLLALQLEHGMILSHRILT